MTYSFLTGKIIAWKLFLLFSPHSGSRSIPVGQVPHDLIIPKADKSLNPISLTPSPAWHLNAMI
ncbi:MAG: hypothetical protein IH589_13350 [Anaerolineales bacterium]|nr:hypothetical protein [Anaerolineales bacterium]